jgi:hypothetical protein
MMLSMQYVRKCEKRWTMVSVKNHTTIGIIGFHLSITNANMHSLIIKRTANRRSQKFWWNHNWPTSHVPDVAKDDVMISMETVPTCLRRRIDAFSTPCRLLLEAAITSRRYDSNHTTWWPMCFYSRLMYSNYFVITYHIHDHFEMHFSSKKVIFLLLKSMNVSRNILGLNTWTTNSRFQIKKKKMYCMCCKICVGRIKRTDVLLSKCACNSFRY